MARQRSLAEVCRGARAARVSAPFSSTAPLQKDRPQGQGVRAQWLGGTATTRSRVQGERQGLLEGGGAAAAEGAPRSQSHCKRDGTVATELCSTWVVRICAYPGPGRAAAAASRPRCRAHALSGAAPSALGPADTGAGAANSMMSFRQALASWALAVGRTRRLGQR